MKKILILAAILLLGLAGCTDKQETTLPAETTSPELTLAPQAPSPVKPLKMPLILRYQQETRQLPQEEPLLQLTGSFPRAWIAENAQAQEKINEALEQEREAFFSGSFQDLAIEELQAQAGETREILGQDFLPYGFGYTAAVKRGDGGILSVMETITANTGGPYSRTVTCGLVFDSRTGERLQLSDLSEQPEAFQNFLLDQMEAQAEDPGLRQQLPWFGPEDYRENFRQLLEPGFWHLDGDGLVLTGREEQFGPHAAGNLRFVIPYESLEPWLKPEYLPVPAAEAAEMTLLDPKGCNARIVDDIYLESGQLMLLKAEGRAEQVELVTASFQGEYREGDPIWYGSFLEDGVLRLETVLPDAAPNLMLKYVDQSGPHRYLLTLSGQDGSYILMEP